MRRLALLAVAAWLAASGAALASGGAAADGDPAGPCAGAPVAGSSGTHFVYGGRMRFFGLHVPAGVPAGRALPLILALHGAGGSGPQMERYSGFSAAADHGGFVVAYPSAASPLWNITASPRDADDVGFIATVIASVEQSVCIDPARVYASGVSNGAGMVALLGCRLSSEIAGIAPVEGVYDVEPPCHPAAPLSVLEIHGTSDTIAPYGGLRRATSARGVPPLVTSWVRLDHCATTATVSRVTVRTTRFAWGGCDGVTVEHIRIAGGRHQWPGATPPDPGPRSTFCGACAILRFFAHLPARPAGSRTGGAALPA